MPAETQTLIIQKATVYDLEKRIDAGDKETYTPEEIKALMDAYIAGAQQ